MTAPQTITIEQHLIEDKRLILIHYRERWTWEEHESQIVAVLRQLCQEQRATFIAFNWRDGAYMPPGGFAAHMRRSLRAFANARRLHGIFYLVAGAPLKALIKAAYRTYAPNVPLYFAHSLEEVTAAIASSA